MSDETKKGADLGTFPIKIQTEKEVGAKTTIGAVKKPHKKSGHLDDQLLRSGKDSLRRKQDYVAMIMQVDHSLVKNQEVIGLSDLILGEIKGLETFRQRLVEEVDKAEKEGKTIDFDKLELSCTLGEFTGVSYGPGYSKKEMTNILDNLQSLARRRPALIYNYKEGNGEKALTINNPKFTQDTKIVKTEWLTSLFKLGIITSKNADGTEHIDLFFKHIDPICLHQIRDKYTRDPSNINVLLRKHCPKIAATYKIYKEASRHLSVKLNSKELIRHVDTWIEIAGLKEQAKNDRGRSLKSLQKIFDGLVSVGIISKHYSQKDAFGKLEYVLVCNKKWLKPLEVE